MELISWIPSDLNPLVNEAKKYPTFEEFKHAFLIEIKHGDYWHITDEPNFKIDIRKGPRDMSTLSTGAISRGKLMVTSDLEYWAAMYPSRKYAALLDFSDVPANRYRQVNRGFGNEFIVDDPSKVKVIEVLPIKEALIKDRKYRALLKKHITGIETLRNLYNKVRK